MTDIPTPTAMRAEWWPATVRLPAASGQPGALLQKVKVYAADTGLYVYSNRNDGQGAPALEFHAPIDYDKTPPPPIHDTASRVGFRIATSMGEVIVQPDRVTGCNCGHKLVKHWRPEWATRVQAWKG